VEVVSGRSFANWFKMSQLVSWIFSHPAFAQLVTQVKTLPKLTFRYDDMSLDFPPNITFFTLVKFFNLRVYAKCFTKYKWRFTMV